MSLVLHQPESIEEALALRSRFEDDSSFLAGGVAFSVLWHAGLIPWSQAISLGRVGELHSIRHDGDHLFLGAMVTHSRAAGSAEVRGSVPTLAEAYSSVATVRIRNQATVGGNLAQADPAHDPPPMLMALEGEVVAVGPGGLERRIPVEDLFVDYYTTSLRPGELITGVLVPIPNPGQRSAFFKFLPRSQDDYATVTVAVSVLQQGGRIVSLRVGLGGVAPTPVRARSVEAALVGQPPEPEVLSAASAMVDTDISPVSDARGSAGYKSAMSRVWVERALREVTGVSR